MPSPGVSVLLPVYNDEAYVEEAIDSVLRQDASSFEIVVIDDGSTDRTPNVLAQYEDEEQVEIRTHAENQGLPEALNTGLEASQAPLLMRQDANDRSSPSRLTKQRTYLQRHPDVAAVTTGAYMISANGNRTATYLPPKNPREELNERNPLVHGSVMFRREAIEDVGGYDEFFQYSQDYDLWVRLVRNGYQLSSIREPLYELRRDGSTESVSKRRRAAKYSLLASAPPNEKSELLRHARAEGLENIEERFSPSLRSKYERRMVRAYVDNHCKYAALKSALRAAKLTPTSGSVYLHLGLALSPWWITERILTNVEGR